VLVVTKADLGKVAMSALRDLRASLRSLGSRSTQVLTVSSLPPPSGVQELVQALEEHRGGLDLGERRLRARRASALSDFTLEHGLRALRALGGRPTVERWLAEQDLALAETALVKLLEKRMAAGASPAEGDGSDNP
jgi:LAO/AO transport system kinase